MQNNIVIIKHSELTDHQLKQLDEATMREWNLLLSKIEGIENSVHFLLMDGERILASGNLKPVYPVIFNAETYSLLNLESIISNDKGKGYGKQIVLAMRKYLEKHDKTGLGFCMPYNKEFYEKCGIKVDTTSTLRFVFHKEGEKITEPMGQYVIYQDGSDKFMEKVLSNPNLEVSIPTASMW